MSHKLSLRQYKRLLGIQDEEQLASLLAEFEALDDSVALSHQAKTALKGMRQYLSQVDEAYTQADRDIALGKRSLELSSDELSQANKSLRHEAETRQQVLTTLRNATNDVLSQLGKRLADEDSLEELSHLLAGLVSELLSTRDELQQALAAIKNQQFALDEHAIVSITDATGNLIYANDKFCKISQYTREELLGANHRIVNSGLHGQEFFSAMWATITRGDVWHGEIGNRAKDQSLYWTSATIVPFLDAQRKPYQYISIRTDITEQRLLKEKIEYGRSLLENIMNTLGEGVYTMDAGGKCTFLNVEAEKILGWTFAELNGQKLHDAIHSIHFDGSHVRIDDCPIRNTIEMGQVYRSEDESFKHKSGRFFPVSIVASPIFENGRIVGSVAAFQDVTARHAAGAALRESEAKQRMLIDNAADAVFVADKDERWIYVNDLALTMLGFSRDELIGSTIYDLLPTEYREISRTTFGEKLRLDKLIRREIHLLKKNGGYVPVEMNVALLPDGSIYGSCRDITDRKAFETALIKAKIGAESASKAKSEFLATMSHEIRTPMNGIIGMTELALDTTLSVEQREYLEMVKLSSNNLLVIINDILDFSKIESGKLTLEKIEFSIEELIFTTLNSMSLKAKKKDIELVCKIDPDIPKKLLGDPGRVRQIITNLVGNAIKFSDHGSIVLELHVAHKMGSLVEIYFAITDAGIGIALDKQASIFEPFSQADTSTTRRYGGTGLGLSISSRLVQEMQGVLRVKSEIGQGSTFYFNGIFGVAGEHSADVSVAIASAWSEGADKHGVEPIISANTGVENKFKILLAEDNPINQKLVITLLQKWGYVVDVAENGVVALEQLKHKKYHVILMDMQMPEMGGIEATQHIRQLENGPSRVSIIAMTANAMPGDQERCMDAGMDHYLSKPIDSIVLRELLRSCVMRASDANPAQRNLESNDRLNGIVSDVVAEFDYNAALSRADLDVLLIIAPLFLDGCGHQVQEIADAILRNDSELLHRSAHTMKGLVGNFHATPIENLSKALERKGKQGDFDGVEIIYEEMNKQLELMNKALKIFVSVNAI